MGAATGTLLEGAKYVVLHLNLKQSLGLKVDAFMAAATGTSWETAKFAVHLLKKQKQLEWESAVMVLLLGKLKQSRRFYYKYNVCVSKFVMAYCIISSHGHLVHRRIAIFFA